MKQLREMMGDASMQEAIVVLHIQTMQGATIELQQSMNIIQVKDGKDK